MTYADTCCTYEEIFEPHGYKFTGPCMVTGKRYSVTVKAEELYAHRQGGGLQALKSNTLEDREFLLTGHSPEGWKIIFPEEEEDENSVGADFDTRDRDGPISDEDDEGEVQKYESLGFDDVVHLAAVRAASMYEGGERPEDWPCC